MIVSPIEASDKYGASGPRTNREDAKGRRVRRQRAFRAVSVVVDDEGPDLVLYYEGSAWQDNFTTGTFTGIANAVDAGYTFVRRECGIFVSQQAGTVSLRLYYSAARGDNFSTATEAGAADALAAGYTFVRNEGFVLP